jgi:calcineurin-like phosphoesterase family protein
MISTFFTSDTHWNHSRIIQFCNRPFKDVDEMNETLIARWNARVGIDDTVWHLGDFALGNQDRVPNIVARLNGTIHLCWGNHDKQKTIIRAGCFASTQDVAEIRIDGETIFLSHYGHRVWNKAHHGAYHLYGHSHGGLPAMGRSLDVGVDCWDYQPVTFAEIKARLTKLGEIDKFGVHHQ